MSDRDHLIPCSYHIITLLSSAYIQRCTLTLPSYSGRLMCEILWRWPAQSPQKKKLISTATCHWLLIRQISSFRAGKWHHSSEMPPQCSPATFFTPHRHSCANNYMQEISDFLSGYHVHTLHVQVIKTTIFRHVNTFEFCTQWEKHAACESGSSQREGGTETFHK